MDNTQFLYEENNGFSVTVDWILERYEFYRKELEWEYTLPIGKSIKTSNIYNRVAKQYMKDKIHPGYISIGIENRRDGAIAFASSLIDNDKDKVVPLAISFSSNFTFTSEEHANVTLLHEMAHLIDAFISKSADEHMTIRARENVDGHGSVWNRITKDLEKQTGLEGISNRFGDSRSVGETGKVANNKGDKVSYVLIRYKDSNELATTISTKNIIANENLVNSAYQLGRSFVAKAKYYLIPPELSSRYPVIFNDNNRLPMLDITSANYEFSYIEKLFGDKKSHDPIPNSVLDKYNIKGLTRNEFKEYFS
jgi:hypothetical protein